MKHYKLIKEYPGSPELGTIVSLKINGEYGLENYPEFWGEIKNNNPYNLEVGKTYKFKYKYNGNISTFKITKITEDGYPWGVNINPESKSEGILTDIFIFLEEVTEKDYEIMSLKNISSGLIWERDSQLKGKFTVKTSKSPFIDLEEINKYSTYYNIHSVKRLSDNKIFTIGDFFKRKQYSSANFKSIGLIETNSGKLSVIGQNIIYGNIISSNLNTIISANYLFTTEDGYKIYEGDELFCVKDNKVKSIYSCTFQENNVVYFKHRENANTYLLYNTKCLSLCDVFKVYPEFKKDGTTKTNHAVSIIDLAKRKLTK